MSALAAVLTDSHPARPGNPPFVLEADLRVEPGITVLFGPSGAGKSTLLAALIGARRPATGRVVLGDRVLFDAASGVNVPVRQRRIGIVFQDALLFPHLDARANVAFGIPPHERKDGAGRWLERVGAAHLASRRPGELSGGERQRVALARALAARPEALLLDEPFSALDAASREKLGGLLLELQREARLPFLHVTHDPAEALRLGEAMVALESGRVAGSGRPADLLAPGGAAASDSVNWLRGTVVSDGPDGARVDLGGVIVSVPAVRRAAGSSVVLALPAEEPILATGEVTGTSARNVLRGEVVSATESGNAVDVVVATPVPLRVRVTRSSGERASTEAGVRVFLLVKAFGFRVEG